MIGIRRLVLTVLAVASGQAAMAQPVPLAPPACDTACPLRYKDEFGCCHRPVVQACTDIASCAAHCDIGDETACTKVRDLSLRACTHGTGADSCLTASGMLWQGIGGPRDPQQGLQMLDKACDAGLPQACLQRSFFAMDGVGAPRDLSRAKELATRALAGFHKRCHDQGDGEACGQESGLALGVADYDYASHTPTQVTPQDLGGSADAARRGCDLGDPPSCLSVARSYTFQASRDPRRAAGLAELACSQASQFSTCSQAQSLVDPGLDPDRAKQIEKRLAELADPACDRGDVSACMTVVGVYTHGLSASPSTARRYVAKTIQAVKLACDRSWKKCPFAVSATGALTPIQMGELQLALRARVEAGCRAGIWQACQLAEFFQLVTPARMSDVMLHACKTSNDMAACTALAGEAPEKFAALKPGFVDRCNNHHDGDACYALYSEGFVTPIPAPPPTDRLPYKQKACQYNGLGCLVQTVAFLGGQTF